jgi:hypothetical protein
MQVQFVSDSNPKGGIAVHDICFCNHVELLAHSEKNQANKNKTFLYIS